MKRTHRINAILTGIAAGCMPFLAGCSAIAKKAPEAKDSAANAKEGEQWNEAVISAIGSLPVGGGYSISVDARDALQAAVSWEENKPAIRPARAQPSFCSGATYVVFLVALAMEQRAGKFTLSPEAWRALMVEGQADGEGVWGRWNANGPGTGRLFYETKAGRSFTDIKEARKGDFVKIFWNDAIGASEKGHSAIFIEASVQNGVDSLSFWSSNLPGGYGTKQVPRSKIKRLLFSRLESPAALESAVNLNPKDSFLSKLEEKSVSAADAAQAVGLKKW